MNNPPANISDKTLIENYGDEGQKGRLSLENFDVAILTDPNFKTHPKADDGNDANVATKDEGVNSVTPIIEETAKTGDVGDINVGDIKKVEENAPLPQADPQAAEYAKLFNDYLRLTGNRPFGGWNLEQLQTELEKEIEKRAEKIKSDNEAKQNASLPKPTNNEEIRLKHKENGREITVTRQAYDNFISKNQPEWVKVVAVPKEIQ